MGSGEVTIVKSNKRSNDEERAMPLFAKMQELQGKLDALRKVEAPREWY